ncbi:MATE family efflux transporter [Cohnella rhizosphaerae]|uniref:Probable multidrug resistance protein NorM n=1 Tax=Cohnella rhizosphaerae TaxID=1457232 RepID=A0A9X4QVQ6_9BACL|nr:MATE family efflux transporter [Cohnella rhizosphaerae]MDG0812713.1 MATE family efflux transporter [Cohnella rhizosphaerae]
MQLAKRILHLALPSIATFSSMTFTGLLVLMIVGKLGAAAIAVVGVTNILIYNMWALCAGIQNAINYLVAQNYGSGEMRLANQRMQIALAMTGILGVILLAGSLLAPELILSAMGLNDEIVALGSDYVMIRMIALIFGIFSGAFFAYLRAIGDTKTPMTIALINSGLVVVLTYVLAYGKYGFPDLGLQGAAWSILIAEIVTAGMCVWVYFGYLNATLLTRSFERFDRKQVKLMVFESAKLSMMEMSNSLGMLVFTMCISRLGTVAIAANEIALNILSFGFMPSNGFGAAATIGTGQEIGKGHHAEAKRFGLMTVLLGLLLMVLISILMFVFALPIAKLYTPERAVYMAVVPLIHLAAFIQLFNTTGIIFGGGLRGIGDTTYLSRVAFVLNWIIFIPCTLLLTVVLDYGQVGAWIALCGNMVFAALANGWRYVKLDWSKARVKSGKASAPAMVSH